MRRSSVTTLAVSILVLLAIGLGWMRRSDRAAVTWSCDEPRRAGMKCTTIEVPEDRAQPPRRRIRVDVAILPVSGQRVRGEAIFVLTGGPGAPSISDEQDVCGQRPASAARRRVRRSEGHGRVAASGLHAVGLEDPRRYLSARLMDDIEDYPFWGSGRWTREEVLQMLSEL